MDTEIVNAVRRQDAARYGVLTGRQIIAPMHSAPGVVDSDFICCRSGNIIPINQGCCIGNRAVLYWRNIGGDGQFIDNKVICQLDPIVVEISHPNGVGPLLNIQYVVVHFQVPVRPFG